MMKKINTLLYLIIILSVIIIVFRGNYNNEIQKFEKAGSSIGIDTNDNLQLRKNFVDYLTVYGNNFVQLNTNGTNEKRYNLLKYDPVMNSFNMDAVSKSEYASVSGNLTGLGSIPASGEKQEELNLALNYSVFFNEFYTKLPDIAWIYYTSESSFIYLYPWLSSEDFMYKDDMKSLAFFLYANPQNNPDRHVIWTPVYSDVAGKGRMVSLSSPIYDGDTFRGVISIDITTANLSSLLNSEYRGYLVDNEYSIVATSEQLDQSIIKLKDLAKISDDGFRRLDAVVSNSSQFIDGNFIYKSEMSAAPWTMLLIEPIYIFVGRALLSTLPILFVVILLIVTYREIISRRKVEKALRESAITDSLTGLKNRRYLDMVIETEIAHSDRYQEQLTIVCLDLDHFKKINDTWGHPIGDSVLKQVGLTISKNVRKSDVLVRLGGEEFMLLLPHTDIQGGYDAAEKIRKVVENTSHPVAGIVTASFGVAAKVEGESFNDLYRRVDHALYLAKERGRNCVARYEE